MIAFHEEQDKLRVQQEIEEKDRQAAQRLYEELLEQERQNFEQLRFQENRDAELARQLQDKEQKKYERHELKKREKELRRERQRLEKLMAQQDRDLAAYTQRNTDHVYDDDDLTNVAAGHSRGHDYPPDELPPEGYHEDFAQNNADKRLSDEPPGYEGPYDESEEEEDEETRQIRQMQDDETVAHKHMSVSQIEDDEEFARLLHEQESKRKSKHLPKDISELTAHDEDIARKMQQEEQLMAKRHQYKRHQKKVSAEIADPDPLVPLHGDHHRQHSVPARIKYGDGGITLKSYTKQSEDYPRHHHHHSLPANSQPPSSSYRHPSPNGSYSSSTSSITSPGQIIDIAATLDPTYRQDQMYPPQDVQGVTLIKKTPLNESLPPVFTPDDDDDDDFYPGISETDKNFAPIQGTRRKSDSKKERKNKGLFGKLKKKKN
ncbi:uncharacterized protein LOC100367332 [Saccoglossus kowalevskii]